MRSSCSEMFASQKNLFNLVIMVTMAVACGGIGMLLGIIVNSYPQNSYQPCMCMMREDNGNNIGLKVALLNQRKIIISSSIQERPLESDEANVLPPNKRKDGSSIQVQEKVQQKVVDHRIQASLPPPCSSQGNNGPTESKMQQKPPTNTKYHISHLTASEEQKQWDPMQDNEIQLHPRYTLRQDP